QTIYQEDIIPVKSFLTENTAELIINELNHAKILQLQIERQTNMIILSLGIILAILIIVVILFAIFLSRSIISPIIRLSAFAKEVSDGKIDKKISEDLLASQDETGSLARSFNVMLTRLNSEIETQKKANDSLVRAEKKLEQINIQLEAANTDLKSLDKQKDEFISLVAHELKTPLTSIRGFTQVLLDKNMPLDENTRIHYLELVDNNTQRLYTLVNDIVDSSRLNLGKLTFHIDEIDIYKIFNEIRDDMTITISKKGLTPEFVMEEGLPNIKADFERTMQVLHNLMSNSIKFTTQGSVSLKIYREGNFVKFEIRDTGQGIPEENKGALFSRFYQVDSSLTRKVGGSGLGLSICKSLVENMGGRIGFDSELGKGSTFYFTLPIVNSTPAK
ncbi:MAG TPA: HAMP domain-containing sensor histidine kinase, partial [Alphaproteobacteria bacterium]|nr:HAMP domain-containing sensor histidine kinase [Alphaproteobacteria bacterium]